MKKLLTIAILSVVATACNKTPEPTPLVNALIDNAWLNSKRYVDGTEEMIPICDRDDTLAFGPTGSTTTHYAIEKCYVGQPKYLNGTYTLNGDQLAITYTSGTTVYTLKALNKDILDMYELKGTDTYRYVYKPAPKK